jgi:hypothetical protein
VLAEAATQLPELDGPATLSLVNDPLSDALGDAIPPQPQAPKSVPMPPHHGRWLNEGEGLLPPGSPAGQDHPTRLGPSG